jgi:Holliday junction DNA helicase RuvB
METSTAKSAAEEALSGAERGPESPRIEARWPQPAKPQPERRRLVRNLRSSALFAKIREAERRMEAGERELGFYLLDLKTRQLHRDASCTSFGAFIRSRTGLSEKKANDLVRVAKALELLPLMDEAFGRGELFWTAVRAMATIATPQTESRWIEYAKRHRVEEVERRVVSARPGEDPEDKRWGRSPVRYPYRFTVNAEVHQAFEALTSVLSLKKGGEVSITEALFLAARLMLAHEIESDGKNGKERKLPSSYRLVIHKGPECNRYWVSTADGPVEISAERAEELLEGAEVLELGEGTREEGICPNGKSRPIWDKSPSEVVSDPQPLKNYGEGDNTSNKAPLVEHAADLSTPEKPAVAKEERDQPNTPTITKEVLSHDGYVCRIGGCGGIASEAHHIVFREHGGRTVGSNLAGFCEPHHSLTHGGQILVSGSAEELIISDRNLHPLIAPAGDHPPSVELEVEPAPRDEGFPPPQALEPPALPGEVSAEWWRAHRGSLEHSEKQNAWVFKPSEEIQKGEEAPGKPEGLAAGAEDLSTFVGQEAAVENLSIALKAARIRGELPPPILLSGPPGLGKTTLARRVARELKGRVHTAVGSLFTGLLALVDILSELRKGDVLFLDEIHSLPAVLAEHLYKAIDERAISVPVFFQSQTRHITLKLEPFVLVGATTEESMLPRPFHSRFEIRERLDFYSRSELEEIARVRSRELGIEVTKEAAGLLAASARGTPRELHGLLRRARDLAQIETGSIESTTVVSAVIAERALSSRGIDPAGLSRVDRRILEVLVSKKRPLGLRSLSDLIGENPKTVAEVYEPYLFREGYLIRTHRGRVATEKARQVFRSFGEAS